MVAKCPKCEKNLFNNVGSEESSKARLIYCQRCGTTLGVVPLVNASIHTHSEEDSDDGVYDTESFDNQVLTYLKTIDINTSWLGLALAAKLFPDAIFFGDVDKMPEEQLQSIISDILKTAFEQTLNIKRKTK